MNRLLYSLVFLFILVFSGCDNDNAKIDEDLLSYERNLTQEQLADLTSVSVDNYDAGWTCLVFALPNQSPEEMPTHLVFYVDMGSDRRIKEGTFNCKDTDSFKRYASFKCGDPNYGLKDWVKVKRIKDDHYEISYSYVEKGQTFEGSYSGEVEHHFYAIDFHPDCY